MRELRHIWILFLLVVAFPLFLDKSTSMTTPACSPNSPFPPSMFSGLYHTSIRTRHIRCTRLPVEMTVVW